MTLRWGMPGGGDGLALQGTGSAELSQAPVNDYEKGLIMPPRVDKDKCNGCQGRPDPRCVNVCPGDLMVMGEDNKAYCRPLRDCWDCMCCTKACPMKAIKRASVPIGLPWCEADPFYGQGYDHVDLHRYLRKRGAVPIQTGTTWTDRSTTETHRELVTLSMSFSSLTCSRNFTISHAVLVGPSSCRSQTLTGKDGGPTVGARTLAPGLPWVSERLLCRQHSWWPSLLRSREQALRNEILGTLACLLRGC